MSEKVLLHMAYPLWRKNSLITLARAKQLQDEGNDVTLTYCANTGGTCAVNYFGNPLTCLICQAGTRRTAQRHGLNVVPLTHRLGRQQSISLSEKKALIEGVYSGLISTFRLFAREIRRGRCTQMIRRRYFTTSLGLLRAVKQVVRQERFDRVEVFNGRHACSKFILLAAKESELPFNTLEMTAQNRPIVFAGHTAHDRMGVQQRILSQQADYEVAETFFAERVSPRHNKFAKRHARQFRPPAATGYRRKITFFLSSQDEFASLGKDWKSPFNDAEIIAAACRRRPDYFFCVRFHPNQADIGSDVTGPFQHLTTCENVQLYYPNDTANTYQLIDWSDVVVTFGSTVTVEACWRGKPAILLGPSFYDQLEVAETPQTPEAFYELLGQPIEPRDRANAARMATFKQCDYDPLSYFECSNGKVKPKGLRRSSSMLTYLARYFEVAGCRLVKAISRVERAALDRARDRSAASAEKPDVPSQSKAA